MFSITNTSLLYLDVLRLQICTKTMFYYQQPYNKMLVSVWGHFHATKDTIKHKRSLGMGASCQSCVSNVNDDYKWNKYFMNVSTGMLCNK